MIVPFCSSSESDPSWFPLVPPTLVSSCRCPFHGQCPFNGSLTEVVPHLASDHQVTPVPVQPVGTLFYRAKQFYRRNVWTLIYEWDKNLFRFIVKHLHSSQVGRAENCNLLIAHIQYIGPESMATKYSYQVSQLGVLPRRESDSLSPSRSPSLTQRTERPKEEDREPDTSLKV